jgi:hypothetical protein
MLNRNVTYFPQIRTRFGGAGPRPISANLGCGARTRACRVETFLDACTRLRILFWEHDQSSVQGIVLNVYSDALEFGLVSSPVVVRLLLPEGLGCPRSLLASRAVAPFNDLSSRLRSTRKRNRRRESLDAARTSACATGKLTGIGSLLPWY